MILFLDYFNLKIHKDVQMTLKSQNNASYEVQRCLYHNIWSQITLRSHGNKEQGVDTKTDMDTNGIEWTAHK